MTIKQALSTKYPWAPYRSNQEDCLQCSNSESCKISSPTPGRGYAITCITWEKEGKKTTYQEETSLTAYARGKKPTSEFNAEL